MKRENCINWDEYFMGVSVLSAMRGKDPHTQVGACIVNAENIIIGTGYNGAPIGFSDDDFPWGREGDALNTKYFYVVHAERNAILNCLGSKKDFIGSRLYVLLFPCNECAKEIVQIGIKEVIYLSDKYADTKEILASKKILETCGVKTRKFESNLDFLTLSFK